ncbi:MAG: histidine kinase [Chitinophagaceae bacterium]|nr:histidine kinase [Chitinophagaceae bacterium]
MNPHFVYNALHNIQGLVLSSEIQKANKQIQSLAQLMRKTFSMQKKMISLLRKKSTTCRNILSLKAPLLTAPLNSR